MRSNNYQLLHPAVRTRLQDLDSALMQEGIDLLTYEAWRDPERQAYLYAQGRVPGIGAMGHYVTRAKPWQSFHQYGLSLDKVFWIDGRWSWKEPEKGQWARYHELARARGLEPLSFETPHVQLAGITLGQLRNGDYPPGGDDSWEMNLESAIVRWGHLPKMVYGISMPGASPLVGGKMGVEGPSEATGGP